MLRAHLFGRPRLLLDEIALPLAGRPKVVPLLAYLLLHRGAPLPRQAVANALWPDEPEDDARANLRRHLNYLQHVLPPAPADRPWIVAGRGRLQFAPDCALWLDVAEFERLAVLPHRRRDAVALYAGDLLSDLDDEWLEAERERLRALYRETLTALVASLRAAREYVPAIAAAQRLLQHDPWREDTLRALMLLRYESGDRAGALAEYERFAHALREDLGTEPMPETTAAYASIARDTGGLPSEVPVVGALRSSGWRDAPAGAPAALPFVGRQAELAVLVERWEAAAAGQGGLVLVGGEAGIGKTRLVHELAAVCEARGGIVYAAAATFPEAVPYQPFAALLGTAAPLLDAVTVDPAWLSALAALAPALRAAGRELPPLAALEPERDRLRLFEAAANVFEALGKRRPLVLVVEELHWAGPATLALLEHLARRFARARVLLIATYREDELELAHHLRALRRRLEREGVGRHVALGRLARAAIDELLCALADEGTAPDVARVLHERSEGNPFFLGELVHGLAETGSLRITGRTWAFDASSADVVPGAVREAVAARVGRLGERASALVEVAATIGRGFDVELLRETTGWPEAGVLDALGELVDRRIVSERGPRGSLGYAFTHHLLQSVVYEGIAPAARAQRHRRVAHVLSELYAEQGAELAAELALHWDRGGEPERAALQYLVGARRALAVYGNEEAHAHLSRSLALSAEPRLRFDALLLRERVEAAAGEREAQGRDCAELAALAHALGGDDAACAVLERRIELANVTSDRRGERVLLALLQRRVRRSRDTGWRMRALEAEARYRRGANDFAGARRAFGAVIALAERSGDRGAHVAARLAVADSYIYEGRLPEAQAALRELRAAVDLDGSPGALVRTLMALARAALVAQDYETMSRLATEAHEISRAIGDREGEALALHTLANGLVYTPRADEAWAHYRAALALYERLHHRVGIASIAVDFGLFHTELGLLDDALAHYARAREVSAEIGFRFVACVNQVNTSYCGRLRGDFIEARTAAESALQLARGIRSQPLESAALGALGAAESELGAHASAVAHLRAAVELRRPAGATPRLGDNLCALAAALLRAGDNAGAQRAATELLALYDANPALPPQPAEWLLVAARVNRAAGNGARARTLLRRAEAVLDARAAALGDPAVRAAFLALPFAQAVREERAVRA